MEGNLVKCLLKQLTEGTITLNSLRKRYQKPEKTYPCLKI